MHGRENARTSGNDAEASLFGGTAAYYARFRRGYPDEVFDRLVSRFALDARSPVLDLGCGTGQIALPLRRRGVPVCAVDADAEMLVEGIRSAKAQGIGGVAWIQGTDRDLGALPLPGIHLCTLGASFHWMDREVLLKTLDGMIRTGGGIAVLSGAANAWSDGEKPPWLETVREVVEEFLGPERRAGAGTYSHPPERHEVVLARSPFSRIEVWNIEHPETFDVEQIVGLQLSTSYASPERLGARVAEFERVLATRLRDESPSGVFCCTSHTEVLVATRA